MGNDTQPKVVTQEDVARLAGVSRSIVSYVINKGPRSVSPETRQRVLDAIKTLGYRPNKYAQLLSSAADTVAEKYIGIILAGKYMFQRPYYGHILASIHEHAHQHDRHIRFIRVFDDFNDPTLFNELIHPDEIGGAILLGLDQALTRTSDHALIEQIIRRVARVVCVEWEWPGIPSVQFDRQDAAYQATRHLLDIGRKHIAYIGPQDRRLHGHHQALWERGISPSEALTRFAVAPEWGYACCKELLSAGHPLDAICTGTDEVAIGVLKCLHEHGLPVPQEVAVASIDNLDISAYLVPSLTTVDIPKNDIGQQAISALLAHPDNGHPPAVSITVRTQLLIRDSTQSANP
jgi:LacI family transcriptional regulator